MSDTQVGAVLDEHQLRMSNMFRDHLLMVAAVQVASVANWDDQW